MPEADPARWEDETLRPPRDESRKEPDDREAALSGPSALRWASVATSEHEDGGTEYLAFERPALPSE